MKTWSAKKQTFFLTLINGIVRAVGLLMRVILSRSLGAEIIGLTELAQSVHMVAIAPLTSGLPAAISRLTAKAAPQRRADVLAVSIRLVRTASALLIPTFLLISFPAARAIGDVRVLPSLWFSAPCILILGYSAACNGYCYGQNLSMIPAVSELIEQAARFSITLLLLRSLHSLTAAWAAAIPTAATMLAEIIGLLFVFCVLKLPKSKAASRPYSCTPVLRLALPATLSRVIQTVLRSLTAILIPLQLQQSGLSAAEATARLGMYNGMVCPVLMLPGIFTSALSMVSLPRIAKAETNPRELMRVLGLCTASCLSFSLVCCAAIRFAAPVLAVSVFRQPEIRTLFEQCTLIPLLMALSHLSGSVLSALGQQKRSLYASCMVALITLFLTWLWAGNPMLRIAGVIRAQYAGLVLSILLSVFILGLWRKETAVKSDDKSV